MFVRRVAPKGLYAVSTASGSILRNDTPVAQYDLVVRETKGTWCVVLCNLKGYVATEAAHHSRFSYSTMIVQLHFEESAEGSSPSND